MCSNIFKFIFEPCLCEETILSVHMYAVLDNINILLVMGTSPLYNFYH